MSNPELQPATRPRRKILVLIGLVGYRDDGSVWYREAGLITRSLRQLGMDAWLVVFGPELTQSEDLEKPLIYAPIEMLEDPAWWKSQAPYGVVTMLWGASRYARIRSAVLQATPRLIEKLDTDGVKSPRVWFSDYVRVVWVHLMDHGKPLQRALAPFIAFARAVALYLFPGLLDRKLVTGLAAIPVVAAESPIAVERLKRWSRGLGVTPPRMACIHHPVDYEQLLQGPPVERKNKIIAVGRMQSAQKNLPLMLEVLEEFLRVYPDWSAEIIGRLPDNLDSLLAPIPPETRKRIVFTGPVPHDDLGAHYRSSKIYLMTSRHEAFCNTASEALCCGCSVVGPVDTAGIPFVTAYGSGTVSCRQTKEHFLDALCAEVESWNAGWRDPERISSEWIQRLGAPAVGGKILDTLDAIPAKGD
jgi:glycosyltransferase involved in cell wall biosynthesis